MDSEYQRRKRMKNGGMLLEEDYEAMRVRGPDWNPKDRSDVGDYSSRRFRGPYWKHIDDPNWHLNYNTCESNLRMELPGEFLGRRRKKLLQ